VELLSKNLQKKLAQGLKGESECGFIPARLMISSSKNLKMLAAGGQFNSDLLDLFKTTILDLEIPPLRNYSEKIPIIVKDYFEECAKKGDFQVPVIEKDALAALCRHDWPENVKELRSVLDKILITGSTSGKISLQELPPEIQNSRGAVHPDDSGHSDSFQEAELSWEKGFIIHHLRKNGWDLKKTCEALKTDKKLFQEKLKRHAIRLPEANGKNPSPPLLIQRTLKRSVVL
jgi:two-component system nitrogen regulation response regulator NtrX